MAVKIRLKRMGKIRAPYYRIVVADSRTKRDGRVIEEIGKYHPKEDPSFIEVDSDRALYWLGVGAQPSEPVAAILKITGDWQKFKGEAAPAPMMVAEPKRDKADIFNEALKDSAGRAEDRGRHRQEVRGQEGCSARPTKLPPVEADAETAAVEEAVAEAEAPVAEAAPVADEAAAEGPRLRRPEATRRPPRPTAAADADKAEA